MKKFLSLLLCITILMSSVNMAFAAESAQDTYNMISVEFSDNIGISETLQVMINDENVYADVEELAARLGYDVNISDEYVAVYNKTLSKNVPYGLTVFYYDSTKVEHMLFNHMTEYEAPFKTIKNESGVWIPLQYSLLLLNSSMMIGENNVLIDMPSKNIIDIYTDILKNNQKYLFNWQDIGLSQKNEDIMGVSAFFVTMFNGLLTMDGASWVQFVQSFALDTSAYDFKYAEELAMLFCTYSDDEFEQEVNLIKSTMSYFTGDGALGKTINTINAGMSNNIEDLLKTCNELKAKLDKNNNASVVAYNKSYQALKNACDDAKKFSDATELYTSVTKEISEATGFLDKFYIAAEVLGFASEFINQDEFSVNALSEFVGNTDSQSVMSNAMKVGIKSYASALQTNVATYSALRYLEEHYDDLIASASKLVSSLGSPAQLMLIAWDVVSGNIPFYKEGLANADSFMVSMYANIFQADAFISYQKLRDSIFSDVNEITPENLYKVSRYCYTYLKLCYINRNAALGALKEKTKEELPYLEEYLNSVNKEIAGYLIQLKNADTDNEEKCYGFLPQDNKEYLSKYDKDKLLKLATEKNYTQVVSDAYNNFIFQGGYNQYTKNWETVAKEYAILDINNDGVPELFINSANMFAGWFNTLLFSYDIDKSQIIFISDIYNYAGISYSSEYNAISYTYIKPTKMCGFREFYELKNNKLDCKFVVGNDTDEKGTYYFYDDGEGNSIKISENQKNEYFDNITRIDYIDLPKKDAGTDIYKDILGMYYDKINSGWERTENVSILFYFDYVKELSDAGYAFVDLDKNGIPELVISSMVDAKGGMIYDLYTYKNGEIIKLLSSTERSRFYLGNDNRIYFEGSDSAFNSVRKKYIYYSHQENLSLSEALICDTYFNRESLYYYANEEYQNPDGSYNVECIKNITEEEWSNKTEQYKNEVISIELKSFDKYA